MFAGTCDDMCRNSGIWLHTVFDAALPVDQFSLDTYPRGFCCCQQQQHLEQAGLARGVVSDHPQTRFWQVKPVIAIFAKLVECDPRYVHATNLRADNHRHDDVCAVLVVATSHNAGGVRAIEADHHLT